MYITETLLHHVLFQEFGTNAVHIQPVEGGSINDAFKVLTSNHIYFIKVNSATKFPHLFSKEKAGLLALEKQSIVRTPKVIESFLSNSFQLLLLEWIETTAPSPSFWKIFGEQLAQLHQVTQSNYGWEEDNYMGAVIQSNTQTQDWASFFIYQRLQPLVQQCHQKGLLPAKQVALFHNLYKKAPDLFTAEPPSLLHGDLWNGNFMCSNQQEPVLIDPAIYYGHRSMDLGMTTLFGGFAPAFYEAYHYHYPLPSNYKEQWALANLYPLLIHLLLFGTSYLPPIECTLNDLQ